jgi:hypothetical protein
MSKRSSLFDSFEIILDIYTSRQVDPAYEAARGNCTFAFCLNALVGGAILRRVAARRGSHRS